MFDDKGENLKVVQYLYHEGLKIKNSIGLMECNLEVELIAVKNTDNSMVRYKWNNRAR